MEFCKPILGDKQGNVRLRILHKYPVLQPCGGVFKHEFVVNLLPSPSVKKFKNLLIFGEVIGKSLVSCFFDSQCSSGDMLANKHDQTQLDACANHSTAPHFRGEAMNVLVTI